MTFFPNRISPMQEIFRKSKLVSDECLGSSVSIVMIEEQIKFLCKWIIENSLRPLTDLAKEALKQAIDSSKNWEQLIIVALLSRIM